MCFCSDFISFLSFKCKQNNLFWKQDLEFVSACIFTHVFYLDPNPLGENCVNVKHVMSIFCEKKTFKKNVHIHTGEWPAFMSEVRNAVFNWNDNQEQQMHIHTDCLSVNCVRQCSNSTMSKDTCPTTQVNDYSSVKYVMPIAIKIII